MRRVRVPHRFGGGGRGLQGQLAAPVSSAVGAKKKEADMIEDRESYSEILMISPPRSLCSGCCTPCATSTISASFF